MATLTAAQWAAIEARLRVLYDPVQLACDGYVITLELRQVQRMRLGIVVLVEGRTPPNIQDHLGKTPSDVGRRFYPTHSSYFYDAAERPRIAKLLGRAEARKRFRWRGYWWTSFERLRRHLLANNSSIQWFDDRADASASPAQREVA